MNELKLNAMKTRLVLLGFVAACLTSCAGFTNLTVPSSPVVMDGDFVTDRYVECKLCNTYVLGIGGLRSSNLVGELVKKAKLKKNEALAYVSAVKNVNCFLGVVTVVTHTVSGYVVRHDGSQYMEYQGVSGLTVGHKGCVEVTEPSRKEVNKKALFAAVNNKAEKDTLAAQTAREVTDALKAGYALGNTKAGQTSGEPQATLKGRTHNGTLPRPSCSVQKEGTVVVEIWVDNYGTVQKAVPGAEGTTVTDSDMWNAARKAAMSASFNMSADAPATQKGTITYKFKLK